MIEKSLCFSFLYLTAKKKKKKIHATVNNLSVLHIIEMPSRIQNGSQSLSLWVAIFEIGCFNEPGCHKRFRHRPRQKSMRFNILLQFLRSFLDIPASLDHPSESDRNDESMFHKFRKCGFSHSVNPLTQFVPPLLQTP